MIPLEEKLNYRDLFMANKCLSLGKEKKFAYNGDAKTSRVTEKFQIFPHSIQ